MSDIKKYILDVKAVFMVLLIIVLLMLYHAKSEIDGEEKQEYLHLLNNPGANYCMQQLENPYELPNRQDFRRFKHCMRKFIVIDIEKVKESIR